ncbi:hypothetical protein chiPu_0024135, partial [Chiloscyllium punctatum]|nr:hypothetical protein [Chiloscyllium punctatum]
MQPAWRWQLGSLCGSADWLGRTCNASVQGGVALLPDGRALPVSPLFGSLQSAVRIHKLGGGGGNRSGEVVGCLAQHAAVQRITALDLASL